ncbi:MULTISPECIES: ABC-type transport auxiliary lipoprotein family protein [Stenotrophomonas]|jgi:cholesterol transport system auxiliary component|uniref:ABC-type transport auxiliary lipoprotein family protein n=1 Tax=Stenotrophomonas TaxID=40323 RepID=UPI00031ECD9F|nr:MULTISPECIES: ABC-type transport auxiliary lipoprotein family protein [Stenotrophomonas]MDX5516392.1 ABC-type transport auxiliary lipoprotein family protein [Stenotrophomonas sp. RG-453]OFS94455.1 ABC transporter [Stenotrophomonas sp. HMSC10F06]
MSHATFFRPLLPIALIAALGGCSLLGSNERSAVTIYSPVVRIQADPSWPTVDWQLVLVKPSAARVVDSPRINVRPTPSELEVYKGVSWAQPATDMLDDALVRGFEDSGRINGVARVTTGIRADYKLAMDVRRFEADYRGQATPTALIEVNAKLIHVIDQRVVADRTFRQENPVGSTDVAQVTAALEQGLQTLTTNVVGWTLVTGEQDHARSAVTPARVR